MGTEELKNKTNKVGIRTTSFSKVLWNPSNQIVFAPWVSKQVGD